MKINKLLILLFALASFKNHSQVQNSSIAVIDDVVTFMKGKKDLYHKVENIKNSSGFRFSFFDQEELQLISVMDSGKIEKYVDWYYVKGSLIYTETNWIDTSGRTLFGEKTYHDQKGMIAWIKSENTFVNSSSSEFIKLDKEISAYALKIRDEALK